MIRAYHVDGTLIPLTRGGAMGRMNAPVGRFANDRAREDYLRAYDAMEHLWPVPVERADLTAKRGARAATESVEVWMSAWGGS